VSDLCSDIISADLRERISEQAYLISRGVRPLALVGTCPSDNADTVGTSPRGSGRSRNGAGSRSHKSLTVRKTRQFAASSHHPLSVRDRQGVADPGYARKGPKRARRG
jgi:hypothetical protein